jgi:hypothetical protein
LCDIAGFIHFWLNIRIFISNRFTNSHKSFYGRFN